MKFIWFSLKLFLMLGVVAGPLAWFGYRTLADDTRTLQTEQRRLAALQYLGALRDWIELLQQHRSASLALLSGDPSDQLNGARLAVALDCIDTATAEMNALDAQLAPYLGTTASWHEIQDQWDDLRAYHVTRKPVESDDLHARLTARVLALARQVGDAAEMPAVPERDRNALFDNVTGQRLGELDRLGAARALTAVAGQRALLPSERARLQALRGQYQGDRDRGHLNSQTALAGNPTLSGDLETLDIIDGVNGDLFFDQLDREGLPADAPSAAAFEQAQKPVKSALQVYDAERDAATRLTEFHIEQGRRLRNLHLSLFLLAFVLGLAAAGLLVRGWGRPVEASSGVSAAAHERYLAALISAPSVPGPGSSASVSGSSLAPHLRLGGAQLRQTAAEVSLEASQARLLAERLAQAADIQAQLTAATERGVVSLSTCLNDLTNLANDTVNGSRHGAAVAQTGLQAVRGALRQLNQSREALHTAFAHVRQLANSAAEIARIAPLLDDISEWTTLLALNASIHAANAGPDAERFGLIAGHAERLASRAQCTVRDVARLGDLSQEATAALTGLEDSGRRLVDSTQGLAQVSQALTDLEALVSRAPIGLAPGVITAQDEMHAAADTVQAVRDLNVSIRDSAEEARRLVASLAQLAKVGELIRGSLQPLGGDANGTGMSSSHLEEPLNPEGSPSMIHGDLPAVPH